VPRDPEAGVGPTFSPGGLPTIVENGYDCRRARRAREETPQKRVIKKKERESERERERERERARERERDRTRAHDVRVCVFVRAPAHFRTSTWSLTRALCAAIVGVPLRPKRAVLFIAGLILSPQTSIVLNGIPCRGGITST
jgi:hypothetical protein